VFYVDVAYVALAIHVCCKCIVLIVSDALDVCWTCLISGCCICLRICLEVFLLMLHMFHIYVVSVSSGCCICSAMATHMFP
jgi:hypothetical protein